MPLYLFYTMVQTNQKWPKTQIKGGGGSCLKPNLRKLRLAICECFWHVQRPQNVFLARSESCFQHTASGDLARAPWWSYAPEHVHSQTNISDNLNVAITKFSWSGSCPV